MSAGLPGFGLGGLLFVICALLAPFVELVRVARGTSTHAAWRRTLRQFAIAVTMVAVFELTRRALGGVVSGEVGLRGVALTTLVLVAVLSAAKLAQLVYAKRSRRLRISYSNSRQPAQARRCERTRRPRSILRSSAEIFVRTSAQSSRRPSRRS